MNSLNMSEGEVNELRSETRIPPIQHSLIIGRHISTDGGLVKAAGFLIKAFQNCELRGASMTINVTRKSVDQSLSQNPIFRRKQEARRARESERARLEKQRLRNAIADSDADNFEKMIRPLGKCSILIVMPLTDCKVSSQAPNLGADSSCMRRTPQISQAATRKYLPLSMRHALIKHRRDLRKCSKTSLIMEMRKAERMGILTLVFQ